jgi:hypothetical protein
VWPHRRLDGPRWRRRHTMNDICDLTEAEIDLVAGGAASEEVGYLDCGWGVPCGSVEIKGAIRAAVNRVADIFR